MANSSAFEQPVSRFRKLLTGIRRQLGLVPEAGLLIVLLVLHLVLGAPLFIALLGILVAGWFLSRSVLLGMAQHALDTACYERAARYVGYAGRLYPFSADSAILQGNIAMARSRLAQAEAAWRKALTLDSERAAVYASLSSVLLETDRADEALAAAEQALQFDRNDAAAHLHLANALLVTETDPATVETVLRKGIALAESAVDSISLRCALAYVLLEHDRCPEARLVLQGSAELVRDCPLSQRARLYYHLGEIQRAFGEIDEARNYFQASERLDPHGRHAAAAWRAARS
jgi:tetratricopeptide (TPR) repeat protein